MPQTFSKSRQLYFYGGTAYVYAVNLFFKEFELGHI